MRITFVRRTLLSTQLMVPSIPEGVSRRAIARELVLDALSGCDGCTRAWLNVSKAPSLTLHPCLRDVCFARNGSTPIIASRALLAHRFAGAVGPHSQVQALVRQAPRDGGRPPCGGGTHTLSHILMPRCVTHSVAPSDAQRARDVQRLFTDAQSGTKRSVRIPPTTDRVSRVRIAIRCARAQVDNVAPTTRIVCDNLKCKTQKQQR
jgi:hypothetical protein